MKNMDIKTPTAITTNFCSILIGKSTL